MLGQHGRRKNIEFIGIPDSLSDNEIENKVVGILPAFNVEGSIHNFKDCYRIGNSQNSSKKTKAGFVN